MTLAAFAVLICIWIALLLPAVLFNQWFTLDMGGILSRAALFPHNLKWVLLPDSPYNIGGRYFPVYWLYNFALFQLFATNVAAHFAVQGVLFVLSLTLTCHLFLKVTGHRKAMLALGVMACLGGAVAENMTTLGKGEPLAYLCLIAIMLIFYGTDLARPKRATAQFAGIIVLAALAVWIKETSLAVLAFPPGALVAWLLMTRERPGRLLGHPNLWRYLILFGSLSLGALIAKAPNFVLSGGGAGTTSRITYLEYKIDAELITDNLFFYATQQPDVLLMGIAALVLCGLGALRIRSQGGAGLQSASRLTFVISMLAMAWGYFLGLMIWRWPIGYYMLLPSIIFKFCAIYGVVFWLGNGMLSTRRFRAVISGAMVCAAYAAIHWYYVAESQITYSRMYTEAISKYVAVSNPKNSLVFESFPFYSEQVNNTREVIDLMYGQSRLVGGIADLLNPAVTTPTMRKLLDISQKQLDNNESALPRKDDYLLVMTGNKLATWFVRGVTPHYSDESILRRDDAYEMIPVAENRVFMPSAFLDIWADKLYFGPTYFGYKLYRVTSERPKLVWRGRYPDGWIGSGATLRLFAEFGKKAVVTVSTPEFNSPNRVTVRRGGVVMQDLRLVAGKAVTFEVDVAEGDNPTSLRFSVARTVVPKDLKLNNDTREIGILLQVERGSTK